MFTLSLDVCLSSVQSLRINIPFFFLPSSDSSQLSLRAPMKTYPMPFLISILFSINREEIFWGPCKETFQEKAHVGRRNAAGQSKKPVLFWQNSLPWGTSFASSSSAGPGTGSVWRLGKAFLKGRTTRMQSCMLPPEPIRAVMMGPT